MQIFIYLSKKLKIIILILICNLTKLNCLLSQERDSQSNIKLGAYYFDGWAGETWHLNNKLIDSFAEREPKWGWKTSSQAILDSQIVVASQAGIDFFSFCWYYYPTNDSFKTNPLNRALNFYLHSPQKKLLKYCLLVVNQGRNVIGSKQWDDLIPIWISYFKEATYLKANEKPLIIFYDVNNLIENFGSVEEVRRSLDRLRDSAAKNGFQGVSIAVCTNAVDKNIEAAKKCGFDMLTGYNYHESSFVIKQTEIPVDSMISIQNKLWNRIANVSSLPYIPVATLNWDPRPWSNTSNNYETGPRFTGFSATSVFNSVAALSKWVNQHPTQTPKEKIALLYAWNEYGEGAYLTPSKNDKIRLLDGIKEFKRSTK